MGLDLTLCPDGPLSLPDWFLAINHLELDRDYRLFDELRDLPSREFDANTRVGLYHDEGLRYEHEDAYGHLLRYVAVKEFRGVMTADRSPWNRAIIRFLQDLIPTHPEMRILLYWH